MPELPEVETTVRLLRPRVVGRRIRDVEVFWPRSLGALDAHQFRSAVIGTRIARLWRRAKYIAFDLEKGGEAAGVILCHLRMTGRLMVEAPRHDTGPYTRVRLPLDRGVLSFVDVRKFGRFAFHADPGAVFARLGVEPLGDDFSVQWLRKELRARKRMLKPLLLDQSFIAGLGNIYVDEALHRTGLHPLRRSDRVPAAAAARLHDEIRATLAEAVEREGSSFDAFYRTPEGRPGSYQHQFRVYGRDGKPCLACGRTLRKIVVAQRGTHLCTRCQPAPRPQSGVSRAPAPPGRLPAT